MAEIGRAAKAAAQVVALAPAAQKDTALAEMAKALRASSATILAANAEDLSQAKSGGATAAYLDRLKLDDKRIAAMADGIDDVRKLARSGRRGDGKLDPSERHDHRARSRAARRDRRDLREPPERDGGCRRAEP